jgi:hypothetical protein
VEGLDRAVDEGDAPGVVGSGEAVLGDDDRHLGDDGGGVPERDPQGVGAELPPHLGQLGTGGRTLGPVRTDLLGGVDLQTDPVVVARNLEEAVVPEPGVVPPRVLGTRHRLVRLYSDGPADGRSTVITQDRTRGRWARVSGHVASGTVTVPLGPRMPLSAAAEAHRLLEGRDTTGKIILRPWEDAR